MVPYACTLDYIMLLSEVDIGSTVVTFVDSTDTAQTATVDAETVVNFNFNRTLTKGQIIKLKIDPALTAQVIVFNLVFN